MNEIISGMRLIKMYAWEWAFHEYVKKIRKSVIYRLINLFLNCALLFACRKESRIISQASTVYIFDSAFYYLALTLLGFVTFSTYASTENTLSPRKVFTSLTLFALL